MRISPITNFSYASNKNNNIQIKRNTQLHFKGEPDDLGNSILRAYKKFLEQYMDSIYNAIARKYLFVKNYENLLFENYPNNYDFRQEIKRRVKLMEAEYKSKDTKIKQITGTIDRLGNEIISIGEDNSKLEDKIKNTNMKNSMDNQRSKKVLLDTKRQKAIYDQLDEKYIALNKLENRVYPNGIMIKGAQTQEEIDKTLKYLQDKHCLVLKTSFSKNDQKQAAKEIVGLLKRIKEGDKHGILYIEDFRQHTVDNEQNRRFIDKLKAHLCSCAKDSNATMLIFENNPEDIDEILLKEHRFGTKIDVSDLIYQFKPGFVPKNDGYIFYYGIGEDETVDLYLGNFGYNKDILWMDEKNQEKALKVLENIDLIKSQDKFKDIKYLQLQKPDKTDKLGDDFYVLHHKTKDYQPIIEKKI